MVDRFVGVIIVLALFPAAAGAATCESLAAFTLPNTKILSAAAQPAGAFTPPGDGWGPRVRPIPIHSRVPGRGRSLPVGEAVEFFQYVVYNDPMWDPRTIEFDSAADDADKAAADVLNVTNPNLQPFFDRGGKLLLYHGWNDQLVAPVTRSITTRASSPRSVPWQRVR